MMLRIVGENLLDEDASLYETILSKIEIGQADLEESIVGISFEGLTDFFFRLAGTSSTTAPKVALLVSRIHETLSKSLRNSNQKRERMQGRRKGQGELASLGGFPGATYYRSPQQDNLTLYLALTDMEGFQPSGAALSPQL